MSKIKNSDSTAGDYNKTKYVAIGNACNDKVGGEFLIYSLQLTPKPSGNLSELPFATLPLSESFENGSTVMNMAANSNIIEATESAPAQDGTHYLEVSAEDCPTILLDNREGTEDKTYDVSAYVKAKDLTDSNIVTFVDRGIFQGDAYSSYAGYDLLAGLLQNKTTQKDLSAEGSDSSWQRIYGRVKVSAGKISELGIAPIDERQKFEFYLDNVTISERE